MHNIDKFWVQDPKEKQNLSMPCGIINILAKK